MYCTNCGKEIKDGSVFCPYCGAKTSEDRKTAGSMNPEDQKPAQPYIIRPVAPVPPEYEPISMWGYFGYELLFGIPFVGFIILIVMCFAPANKNVKNFSRAHFCWMIIVVIVLLILIASGVLAGLALFG